MKKHTMLGVKGDKCCVLECLLPFDSLAPTEIEASDFAHYATNWCGCDHINRTCGILAMKPTGRKIHLDKPIAFTGADSDMGHTYGWRFDVEEIYELEGTT